MDTYEFNSIGSALGREGKFDEAILYFDRAIKLDKSNVKANSPSYFGRFHSIAI